MYRFSRSIYRELAPRVVEDQDDPTGCANKQRVLDACEGALRRLATDRRYFAKPTRTLFTEVQAVLHAERPAARLQGDRGLHGASPASTWTASTPEELNVPRPQGGMPGAHAKGHALPARAAAGTRLLPLAQAPGGDVRARRGGLRARPRHRRADRHSLSGDAIERGLTRALARPRPAAGSGSDPAPTSLNLGRCCWASTSAGRSRTPSSTTARRLHTAKAPTTPDDQSRGVIAAVEAVLERAGARPAEVESFAHGMTVGTNALLEERGARTALLATAGFTDLLEIAPPGPAQPLPALRAEAGAARARGAALRRAGAHRARRRDRGARARAGSRSSSARCAPRTPSRSRSASSSPISSRPTSARWPSACAPSCPTLHVSASHEVLAQFREYERCSTTVIDAYLSPLLGRYLGRLTEAAAELGLPEPVVMRSSGGRRAGRRGGALGRLERPLRAGRRRGRRRHARGRVRATATRSGSTWAAPPATSAWSRAGAVRRTDSREIGGRVLQLPMVDVHTVGAGGGLDRLARRGRRAAGRARARRAPSRGPPATGAAAPSRR